MPTLSAAAYRGVLDLVAEALRRANPEFPDGAVTGFLRNMFHAEFAGAQISGGSRMVTVKLCVA